MSVHSPSAQLAVLYEHPQWFPPLFAALERRGMPYRAIELAGHGFDPASREVPAPLVLSRVAQSSFLREPEHPIFYAEALLDHWARCGARVLNGADVLAIDSSKARQLSLVTSLGYAVPETRVGRRPEPTDGTPGGAANFRLRFRPSMRSITGALRACLTAVIF